MAKPKIHWYYGCCWGRACDLQCASASFAKQAAENPDWYCVTCTKAARLALAKEQPVAVSFSSTVRRCARCRSGAINPSDHGRTEGVDLDLCDVCYWRKRAESASWPEPRPISDLPIDRPVPVYVPNLGWVIGSPLSVGWDGLKHVAVSILSTEGNVIHPTHFWDVILPLPPEVK